MKLLTRMMKVALSTHAAMLTSALSTSTTSSIFQGSIGDLKSFSFQGQPRVLNLTCEKFGKKAFPYTDVNVQDMKDLLSAVVLQDVETLNLLGATLQEGCGYELSWILRDNKAKLTTLLFHASQVSSYEMCWILNALATNQSLKYVFARSYNCQARYWTRKEVEALVKVIQSNLVLKKMEFPYNRLDTEGAELILEAISKRVAPLKIIGFETPVGPFNFKANL